MLTEIWTRQSVRRHEDRTIEKEKLEELLCAAMHAPMARNTQSWRFMVIRNWKTLDETVALQPYIRVMKTAPCAILVVGDQRITGLDEYPYCDCSVVIQNISIEARYQGLSTCWCAVGPRKGHINSSCSYYKLKEDLLPVTVIAVSYGHKDKGVTDHFDPDKISYFD